MAKSFTWRDLLAEIISNASERHQLATRLNVNPLTLTRWSKGVSMPRLESLYRLMEALPAYRERLRSLVAQEIPEFGRTYAAIAQKIAEHIPSSLYTEILSLWATSLPQHRSRIISERLLSGLLEQLDPQQVGTMAAIALFTPPLVDKPVRSLHIFKGQVTPRSWEQKLYSTYPYLFGAESLTGYSMQANRLQSLHTSAKSNLPIMRVVGVKGAVACPIRSFSRVAGSLYVATKQVDYFLPPQLRLIDAYAQLAILVLDDHDFYEFDRIALSLFPAGQEQVLFARAVQYRMTHESKGSPAFSQYLMPRQIEDRFWQLLEQQLLDQEEGDASTHSFS
jgi:transcriptional regulator with XRE-family HTH domain